MEAEERPKAFEELGKQIQKYLKILEAYKAKVHACLIKQGSAYSFCDGHEYNYRLRSF